MRVSIEKGFQPLVREVMEQIRTEDPKLAVHHIIGCWSANQGCPGLHNAAAPAAATQPPPPAAIEEEFAAIADWSN
ncbi:MAG: hypothetical protein F6K04_19685 [Leptolyngbya sp. SIO4C5]|nr:hypothetical protein [Leptolyngbya sp. SIO4C5]